MLNEIINRLSREEIKYSLYIKNLATQEVIKYRENKMTSSASIIKIFIMAYVFDMVEKGEVGLDYKFSIKTKDKVEGGIIHLLSDEIQYSLKDLITLMIIESDNTATNILIDFAGMESIGRFIHELGFKDTLLNRKMMDLEAKERGNENFTTAGDVGDFLEMLYKGDIISGKFSKLMLEIMEHQRDNRMIKRELNDETRLAHKTGDLQGLNHDAGIIFNESNAYIFVMFTWNAKDNIIGRRLIGEVAKMVNEAIDQ